MLKQTGTRMGVTLLVGLMLTIAVLNGDRFSVVHAHVPDELVEIVRDRWGIPHVFANSSEGAFFGLGYATADDRMFQMEYSRRIVQGRIAEIIGEDGVASDSFWKTLGWYQIASEVADHLDGETKTLLQAYAAGVNHYLDQGNGSLLYLFDDYGIHPDPWTVADSIACWYRVAGRFNGIDTGEVKRLHQFEGLVQQVGWDEAIAQMATAPIVDESGAIVQQGDMDPELVAEIRTYADVHGYSDNTTSIGTSEGSGQKASHAWVIGGKRSTTGSAILHSDPQLSISAPSVWHEVHICGGEFNVRGVGVAGAPGLLIGWNQEIAWGATAARADVSDLFKLQINPVNANQYYYDGAYHDMEISEEDIQLHNGTTIPIICRKTVWGPVVTSFISQAEPDEEFALKHAEVANTTTCSLKALIRLMQAQGWDSFQSAIEDYRSPVIHVVYGDRQGNSGYTLLAGVPLRSTAWPFYGTIVQPGNSSVYDWQDLIPKRYLPHMLNPASGVISAANNMAVGSWYPLPLGTGTGDTIRSWRLRELLDQRSEYSQDDVLAIHRDLVDPAVREIVRLARHMVYVLGDNLSQEAMHTLESLEAWNDEYNASLSVYPLIESFNLMFRLPVTSLVLTYGGGEAGLCYFAKTSKSHLDEDPTYVPSTEERDYVDSFLATAWVDTVTAYGDDPAHWLENYELTLTVPYQNNLENFGSLDSSKDQTSPDLLCKHTSTIWSQHGNSYSQNVRFDNVDLARSLLPPGLSEDPHNPFFNDEIPLWIAGELHAAPLTRGNVTRIMSSKQQLTYTPIQVGGISIPINQFKLVTSHLGLLVFLGVAIIAAVYAKKRRRTHKNATRMVAA